MDVRVGLPVVLGSTGVPSVDLCCGPAQDELSDTCQGEFISSHLISSDLISTELITRPLEPFYHKSSSRQELTSGTVSYSP